MLSEEFKISLDKLNICDTIRVKLIIDEKYEKLKNEKKNHFRNLVFQVKNPDKIREYAKKKHLQKTAHS